MKIIVSALLMMLLSLSTQAQTWQQLMDSTNFYQEKQDYSNAIFWAKHALPLVEKEFGENDTNYTTVLGTLANLLYYSGKLDSAIYYQEIHLKLCGKFFKTDHSDLAGSMNNLAMLYNDKGRFTEAETLLKKALEMRRRVFKSDNKALAISITNMANFFDGRGRFTEAEPLYKEALEMYRRLFKSDNPDLAQSINNMALFNFEHGRYDEAEPLYKEALEMYRRLFKSDNPDLAVSINNLAMFYNEQGKYTEAEPLMKEALEMNKRLYNADHPILAVLINNMALFYTSHSRYSEAETLFNEALAMIKRVNKTDNPYLAQIINNMAYFYILCGRHVEAGPLLKESLEMNRRLYKIDHPYLQRSITNMAAFIRDQGNFTEAEQLFKEALEMNRRLYKVDHPDLATSINNMANFYDSQGRYAEAEPLFKESFEMNKRLYKVDHPDLAMSMSNIAYFYLNRNRFDEAEPLFIKAIEMNRRLFKSDHPNLASSLNNMAYFYNCVGRDTEAELLYIEALQVEQNMINNYFPSLSNKEKKQYWNTMSSDFERFNTFAVERANHNPTILGNLYDYKLSTKAMLFNSSINIKNRIMNSGDSILIDRYKHWTDMREFLVKLYKMTNDDLKKRNFNIDSIENAANEMEKQINLKSEAFKQSFEKKKVTWKTIQAVLKPDEAAVEVIRFRYHKQNRFTDTIYYAFLIITNQTKEHPSMVVLNNGNLLENEYFNDYRSMIKKTDTASFGNFWGKLNEKLKNFRKIYFSPDGIYNKLNPSTFLMPDGKYLLELQDIHIVNSTKDLILKYNKSRKEGNKINNAVLIGNPNFSLTESQVRDVSKKIRSQSDEVKNFDLHSNTRTFRQAGLQKLPGTETEIDNIEKYLKSKKWEVNSYLGDMAVKVAVKSVNNPRVLHIATHGMFLKDVKLESKETFGFETKKVIENPLLRSGLFFTGANNYLNSDSAFSSVDDNGLLTAYEAMNLDLDKTELVVLSACETGLGEIVNGEGVYGLRRAFQQAGAKTIVMSLWKVNDEATQELMSDFYQNWVSGMTKREAFSKAQQQIKAKYKDPYYWGAFVMVGE